MNCPLGSYFTKMNAQRKIQKKKFSLARFQSVNKIQMKHRMKERGMYASTLEKYINYCMVII